MYENNGNLIWLQRGQCRAWSSQRPWSSSPEEKIEKKIQLRGKNEGQDVTENALLELRFNRNEGWWTEVEWGQEWSNDAKG